MATQNSTNIISDIVMFLDIKDDTLLFPNCHISSTLSYDFDINPEEFLEFAERDIANEDKYGSANALTNAKRAIDAQIDIILLCFGLHAKFMSFPKKAKILREIGVITPSIIEKIIRLRNELEHEYKYPTKDRVRDALDTAHLFVIALNSILHLFPELLNIGTSKKPFEHGYIEPLYDKIVVVEYDRADKEFYLGFHKPNHNLSGDDYEQGNTSDIVDERIIKASEKDFTNAIRIASWANRTRKSYTEGSNFLRLLPKS